MDDAAVRIVADDTVNGNVLTLKEFIVLVMMQDETLVRIEFFDDIARVTLAAIFCIPIYRHTEGNRMANMQTAGTMALLTLDSSGRPSANHTGHSILISLWTVSGCVARAAVEA
jgi:hypothetical protein